MNYELRPPNEFTLLNPESERQSNGDAERSRILLEFKNALVSQLDLQELLKSIFEQIKQVFRQATAATLAIHDPRKNELRIHLLHSDDPDLFREGMPLSLDNTPSGLAFRSRQTVLINKLTYEDFPSCRTTPRALRCTNRNSITCANTRTS